MKKLLFVLITLAITFSASFSLAIEEGERCVLPNDYVIGFVFISGEWMPAQLVGDTTVTVTKITRNVPNPQIKGDEKDIAEFSLGYDKPTFYCQKHGSDPYETYKNNLGADVGVFFLEDCKPIKKE